MIYEKILKVEKKFKYVKGRNYIIYKTFSFIGDKLGSLGYGVAKSRNQNSSFYKSLNNAKKNFKKIFFENLKTIPYCICSKFLNSKIILMSSNKSGILANTYLKVLFNILGLSHVICKVYGNMNLNNMIIACIKGLYSMKSLYFKY